MVHIAVGYRFGLILCKHSMVGLHIWMDLMKWTLYCSVLVLNVVLLDSTSTSSNVFLDHPVFSSMC